MNMATNPALNPVLWYVILQNADKGEPMTETETTIALVICAVLLVVLIGLFIWAWIDYRRD